MKFKKLLCLALCLLLAGCTAAQTFPEGPELVWSPFTAAELRELFTLPLERAEERFSLQLKEDSDGPSTEVQAGGLSWKLSMWETDGAVGGVLLQRYWLASDWTGQALPAEGTKSAAPLAESFDVFRQCFADFEAVGALPEGQTHQAMEQAGQCLLAGEDGAAFAAALGAQEGTLTGSARFGPWQLGQGLKAWIRFDYRAGTADGRAADRGSIGIWLVPETFEFAMPGTAA